MHTRREALKLFCEVFVVAGVVAAVPTASLFGAPVPTVSKEDDVADCECECKCDPEVPVHEHLLSSETKYIDENGDITHVIHQWEMPSHTTPGWVPGDA